MKYTFPLKKTVGWTALGLPQRLCSGIQAIGHVLSIRQRLVCREWRRSPDSTPLRSLSTDSWLPFELGWVRSIEPAISIGHWAAGKSSIRRVECRMRKLASTMPKVGCGKRKLKGQMLDAKKWMYIPLNLKVEFENLTAAYKELNVEYKKVESWVQTQMTSTKCRIDSLSTIVKWNIEFWRKWNAIELIILRNTGCFLFFRQTIKTCQGTLYDWFLHTEFSLGHKRSDFL